MSNNTPRTSYVLPTEVVGKDKGTLKRAGQSLLPLLKDEKKDIAIAFVAVLLNSLSTLLGPILIARAVDTYIIAGDFRGVLLYAALLFGVYVVGFVAGFNQIRRMGGVGRRVIFRLRNELFTKIQELPTAFFNQNKAGDLISRINNDTDKLNQFFSQALMQFFGNAFLIAGAGIFLVALDWKLGLAALVPAAIVFLITQAVSGWVKRRSRASLQSLGLMSAEIQESLVNFKVIAAFHRFDYFREKFGQANLRNYKASVQAGIASNIFTPLYTLAANIGQLIVLAYGIYLISVGQLTLGLLIGYVLYVTNFYNPLRQLATVWSSLQLALASLDRVRDVLALSSDMPIIEDGEKGNHEVLLEFKDVSFSYPEGKQVLHGVNLELRKGKTYALVGPTGGGKTTTASLMARLFDPTEGTIFLNGKDIRSFVPEERTQKIGFILQEPFLFSGSIRDNIVYGNQKMAGLSTEELEKELDKAHLSRLIARFEEGLDTKISATANVLSLGQKQLVAFMRATLRDPEILILDEATANIDTVTEQLLEEILEQLPKETTKVIIAHRLNTIQDADEIFFVNGGSVTPAGSFEHAVEMLLHGKRDS
jgi:ATP-binding cassette subfamily B protein